VRNAFVSWTFTAVGSVIGLCRRPPDLRLKKAFEKVSEAGTMRAPTCNTGPLGAATAAKEYVMSTALAGVRRQRKANHVVPTYRVTDRLHEGRAVHVPSHGIAPVVSAWLAELGAHSPLVEDLVLAVRAGDWPAAYDIGDRLSVEVTVAA
jgi:hypothetical protein